MTTSLSTSTTRVDHRRMDERDADYQRLHAATAAKLWQALRRYAQALAASARMAPQMGAAVVAEAQSAFIRQQVETLRSAYLAAHWEGERDYWGAHTQPGGSAAATRQRHLTLSRAYGVAPNLARLQRTLAFYAAASVTKMAREGLAALHASQAASRATTTATEMAEPGDGGTLLLAGGGLPPQLAQWLDGLTARVGGQAEIVWPGLQDGYTAAGSIDPANPYAYVWWALEPTASHCGDCPPMAAASPYSAPGSGGMFGNELWVTPGDGTTACGGGCKCTLQWSPPGEPPDQATAGPSGGAPGGGGPTGDGTGDGAGGEDAMATTTTGAQAVATPPWTTAQVTALDQMRAALIAWDRVRGGGPRFNVFAPDDSDLTQAQLIGNLTVAQARALARFAAARQAYRAAVLQAIPAAHASLTKGAFAE